MARLVQPESQREVSVPIALISSVVEQREAAAQPGPHRRIGHRKEASPIEPVKAIAEVRANQWQVGDAPIVNCRHHPGPLPAYRCHLLEVEATPTDHLLAKIWIGRVGRSNDPGILAPTWRRSGSTEEPEEEKASCHALKDVRRLSDLAGIFCYTPTGRRIQTFLTF